MNSSPRPDLIEENVDLKPYNTWLVGGVAEFFALPSTEKELLEAWSWALQNRIAVTFLGSGSNVLVSDQGILGLVIALKKYSSIETQILNGKLILNCDSGAAKSELLKIFLKHRLAPALFLAGIPGQVGGGVYMNAGVAESIDPREFCDIVTEIEVIRPRDHAEGFEKIKFLAKDLKWSYRHCEGWGPGFISKVKIEWPNRPQDDILGKVKEANRIRLSKQPLDWPSCGSTFVNPRGHKAAQLIDQCGLKGFRIGGAEVSTKHANFLINAGSASATDFDTLIKSVQKTVLEKTKVELKTEVVYLGNWT
jgi:UDP-N-acetylmuramate dehydrogenase